jgi:hypothetical protein
MVCAEADNDCPLVPGTQRLSLPFDDPGHSDGRSAEAAAYDAARDGIGATLYHTFQQYSNHGHKSERWVCLNDI